MTFFFPGAWRLSVLSLLLVGLVGWYGLWRVEQEIKENLALELTTILNSSVDLFQKWVDEKRADVETWADEPIVHENILSLADKARQPGITPEELPRSPEQVKLRQVLGPVVRRHGHVDFVVFDRTGLQIAALLDSAVGSRAVGARSDFVERSLKGETALSHPFPGEIALPTQDGAWKLDWPTMFVSAPVRDSRGKVAAVLAFRIRPEAEFTRIFTIVRAGKTGENYAFNRDGRMLSDSRFNEQLRKEGLLPDREDSHAILNVYLRDHARKIIPKSVPLDRSSGEAPAGHTPGSESPRPPLQGGEFSASAPGQRPEVAVHAPTALNDARSPSGPSPLDPTSTLAGGGVGSSGTLAGARPLTRMAASAVKGESGIDVDGYNDYRGIRVVGAWTWIPRHDLGIASEIDALEAFATLVPLKSVYFGLLSLLTLVMVSALVLRARHSRAEQERLYAEEALRRNEERIRSVIYNAMDGIVTIYDDGTIESFNTAAERLFGYSEDEAVGKNVNMLMPEPHKSQHDGYLKKYLRTGQPKVLGMTREVPAARKNGETFLMEVSISEMFLGERRMFIGIVRDISERKRSEEVLKRKTAYVRMLQEVAIAANEALTVESAMQSAMDHICGIIGWPLGHLYLVSEKPARELVPTNLWHITDPEKYAAFVRITGRSKFSPGVGLPGRIWVSGKPEWIRDVTQEVNFPRAHCRATPDLPFAAPGEKIDIGVRGGFGFPVVVGKEIVGVLEFYTSEAVERDDKLLEVMVNMGVQLGRVVERKRAEKNLQRYADGLERGNQELRDFTFIASHDLQEPLRKVISFSDRLSQSNAQNLDDRGRHYLMRLQASVLRMQSLIYDLLEYTRVTADFRNLEKVSVEDVVAEILMEMREDIETSGARIEIKPLPAVEATHLQIHHLFQNLISNALKFRKTGAPPSVAINGKALEDGFHEYVVEDNGIGFDQKYAERIFKPFQKLHGRNAYPGSGMGLAICQKIASNLGGTILVKSSPDAGSKFIVRLPEKRRR
ncbi:MAG: PAS domain S-box protein [Nitrospinae bacterium]|nr:PAS domain S-box protein [Nitrospinota bacterium]